MEPFVTQSVSNSYTYYNPNPKAKYGIAFTFWYSNIADLIFACELIRKEWINQEFIEISVGSYASLSPEDIERLKPVVNYIVKVDEDRGHFDGTTSNCNGAMYPLMTNENLTIVAHSDSDVPWINQTYFFGFAQMLADSGKLILTSQDTFLYDNETMRTKIYEGHDIDQHKQFGSMFFLDRVRALSSGYFPFALEGHFERDRFTHFDRLGFTIDKDAILIKRTPIDIDIPDNFLYSFDFNLGVVHQTNILEHPEKEDRKARLLKLMYQDGWDNMTLGWRGNYNPKSPRQNYGPAPTK
jgi:histidinol phosphatase-like PHP family hydrolase